MILDPGVARGGGGENQPLQRGPEPTRLGDVGVDHRRLQPAHVVLALDRDPTFGRAPTDVDAVLILKSAPVELRPAPQGREQIAAEIFEVLLVAGFGENGRVGHPSVPPGF